jgi:hypothetical protein
MITALELTRRETLRLGAAAFASTTARPAVQSGIGREFSLEGMLDSFTQKKNVTVNLNTPSH